jgi:hypothetical protein
VGQAGKWRAVTAAVVVAVLAVSAAAAGQVDRRTSSFAVRQLEPQEIEVGRTYRGVITQPCEYRLFKIWVDTNRKTDPYEPWGGRGPGDAYDPHYRYYLDVNWFERNGTYDSSNYRVAATPKQWFSRDGELGEPNGSLPIMTGSEQHGFVEILVTSISEEIDAPPLPPSCAASGTNGSPYEFRVRIGYRDAPSPLCTIYGTRRDDVIVGTPKHDKICAFGGNDVIRGMGGNDVIEAGHGRDVIDGGAGNDLILAVDAERDTIEGGSGKDHAWGDGGLDRLVHVESRTRR